MIAPALPELGFYTLAGAPASPREMLGELALAEEMGLGKVFISERFNIKEAVTLSGAAAAATKTIGISTAATNHNTRHPIVTASWATTMHRLTEGRFTLGIGRGIEPLFDAFGIPRITTAQMEDFATLMRRLWRGETVVGHDGPAGRFPVLRLDPGFDESIPLGIVAFGDNTLRLAGRAFDEVVLHTFFSDETLARCVATVKRAAEEAGRDPATVRVWSCLATVGDHLSEQARLKKTVGRLATYLQVYGDLLVRTNGWDQELLARFRADDTVRAHAGRAIDQVAGPDDLARIERVLPPQWLACAAVGGAAQCVEVVRRQFELGADGVILHGASPEELAPIVKEYRRTL